MLDGCSRGDQIKAEAGRIIAECGFDAMSLRALAAACGVTPAAIYAHFPSKHALLQEVAMEFIEELLLNWRLMKRGGRSPLKNLKTFFELYVNHQAAHPNEQRVLHFDRRRLKAAARHRVEFLMSEYRSELKKILEAGKAEGAFFFEDADFIARMLQEIMMQICVSQHEGGISEKERIVGALCRCAQGLTGSVGQL